MGPGPGQHGLKQLGAVRGLHGSRMAAELVQHPQRTLLQSLKVVAAFQNHDHPSLTDRVRQDFELMGDGGESVPSDAHAGQGVFEVSIEAG